MKASFVDFKDNNGCYWVVPVDAILGMKMDNGFCYIHIKTGQSEKIFQLDDFQWEEIKNALLS